MKKSLIFFNDSGFTIVELMIATTLLVVIGTAFYAAFGVMRDQMWRENIYMNVDSSAKNAMERISKDAKEAITIVSSRGSDTTGTSVLILRLPSVDASGVPTNITTDFDYVVYKLDDNTPPRLTRTLDVLNSTSLREGGADVSSAIVARFVNSVQFSSSGTAFSSLSGSAIQALKQFNAQITSQSTTFGTTQQTQLDSEIVLRNKIS